MAPMRTDVGTGKNQLTYGFEVVDFVDLDLAAGIVSTKAVRDA